MLFLLPVALTGFAIYDSENGTVTRLVPAGRNEGEGMYFISMNLNGDIVSAFDFGTKKFVEINLNEYATPGYQPTFTSLTDNNKTPIGAIRIGDPPAVDRSLYPRPLLHQSSIRRRHL